ncbi:unnamed protein product, partial [Brassica oleracea]
MATTPPHWSLFTATTGNNRHTRHQQPPMASSSCPPLPLLTIPCFPLQSKKALNFLSSANPKLFSSSLLRLLGSPLDPVRGYGNTVYAFSAL